MLIKMDVHKFGLIERLTDSLFNVINQYFDGEDNVDNLCDWYAEIQQTMSGVVTDGILVINGNVLTNLFSLMDSLFDTIDSCGGMDVDDIDDYRDDYKQLYQYICDVKRSSKYISNVVYIDGSVPVSA